MEGSPKKIKRSSKSLASLPPCLLEWFILKFLNFGSALKLLFSDKIYALCERRGILTKLFENRATKPMSLSPLLDECVVVDNVNAVKHLLHLNQYQLNNASAERVALYLSRDPPNVMKFLLCDWVHVHRTPFVWFEIITQGIQFGALNFLRHSLPNFEPSDRTNFSIFTATHHRQHACMELLLADPRVNPADGDNRAILRALANLDAEACRLLLRDERVRQVKIDSKDVAMACITSGSYDLLELLAAHGLVPRDDVTEVAERLNKILAEWKVSKILK